MGIGAGWSCLDAGAGSGSLARWMLEQVGASGRVLAIDLDEQTLRDGLADTRAEVRRVDVIADELPEGEFDLVHSRLMLCNLPDTEDLVRKLARALRPGGVLVLADLDFTPHRPARAVPAWHRVWPAFLRALTHAGWDPAFGRRLPTLLESAGLEHVEAETIARSVRGGSTPCRMTMRALERGMPVLPDVAVEDLDVLRSALHDPRQAWVAPEFTMAVGRRAPGTA